MTIYLKELWEAARYREPGFLDDVLNHSKFDRRNNAIDVSKEHLDLIEGRWPKQEQQRGLGDVRHLIGPEERQRLIERERQSSSGCLGCG